MFVSSTAVQQRLCSIGHQRRWHHVFRRRSLQSLHFLSLSLSPSHDSTLSQAYTHASSPTSKIYTLIGDAAMSLQYYP